MYAVVQTGGKQYRVKAGDVIRVGKLEKNLGDKFNLDQVLMVGGDTPTIGSPLVKGASVSVVVTRHDRGAKITTLKRKRRKGYRKTIGHRQEYTELFVSAVSGPGGSEKSDKEPVIFDKEKAAERKAERVAKAQEQKKTRTERKSAAKAKAAAPKAKKVAKKASGKKTGAKKASAKKKSSAKKSAAKKK